MIKVQVNKENWKKVSLAGKTVISFWMVTMLLFFVMAITPLRNIDYVFNAITVSSMGMNTILITYLLRDILKKRK